MCSRFQCHRPRSRSQQNPLAPRAETYGRSEEVIGSWLAARRCRDKVVIASKVTGPSSRFPYIRDGKPRLNRQHIEPAIDGSLKRLRCEEIDLYQLHWPDRNTNTFGSLAYRHDENEEQVPLTPKTFGAFTEYTRQLLLQSSIDVEGFVRNDLARVLALGIDHASLYGTGSSNQPTGVSQQSGINAPTSFAAANPTFAEVVTMETEVAVDNADEGALAYVCRPDMRGYFKSTEKFSSTGMTIWEPGNTVNGYGCGVSSQVTAGDLFFGNWNDLMIGMWGGLDIMVNPYALDTSGGVRIVALQSMDIAVRHPVSFAFNNDGV